MCVAQIALTASTALGELQGGEITNRHAPTAVSVVISVRNGAPWITDQLIAITSQELTIPFEILIADGGSTDDTVDRCHAFRCQEPPVHIIDASKRRGKQYGQRLGVRAAAGDFIAFADADDLASPGWLRGLLEPSSEFEMVGGPLDITSLNEPAVVASRPYVEKRVHGLTTALGSGLLYAAGANSAIWRDIFLEIDDPEHDLPAPASASEDLDLMFRLTRAGGSVGFAPDAVMAYRLRADGRALRRQMRSYGVGHAAIVKRYRDLGAKGDSLSNALKKWAFIAPRAAKASLTREDLHWARSDFAFAMGRLEGSFRYRVWCL